MSENSNGRNWWHTLPGVITAVTGLLTAVSGLLLALNQAGIFEDKEPSVVQGQATPANGKGKPNSPKIHAATPVLTQEPTVPEEKPAPLALNVEGPASAGPRRSAIAAQDLETFAQSYLGVLNRCKPAEILGLYADAVDYFEAGTVTKDFIFQDKDRYCRRWEEVRYERVGTVAFADTGTESEKQLTFKIRFFGRNPARGAMVSGTALTTLVARAIDGEIKIVDEKQRVTKRKQLP